MSEIERLRAENQRLNKLLCDVVLACYERPGSTLRTLIPLADEIEAELEASAERTET